MLRCLKLLILSLFLTIMIIGMSNYAIAMTRNMLSRHHRVAEVAARQIGDSYVWGTDGPSTFDCSGLALFSWRIVGRSIAHNADAEFNTLPHIAPKWRHAGDLVYFNFDGGDIDHVGVLVGVNRMIHASDRVEAQSLTGFYKRYIVGYRRPDK